MKVKILICLLSLIALASSKPMPEPLAGCPRWASLILNEHSDHCISADTFNLFKNVLGTVEKKSSLFAVSSGLSFWNKMFLDVWWAFWIAVVNTYSSFNFFTFSQFSNHRIWWHLLVHCHSILRDLLGWAVQAQRNPSGWCQLQLLESWRGALLYVLEWKIKQEKSSTNCFTK